MSDSQQKDVLRGKFLFQVTITASFVKFDQPWKNNNLSLFQDFHTFRKRNFIATQFKI